MQAVISSWLSLEKITFKPENKTIYSKSDHFWGLKLVEYCVQEKEKLCRWGRQQEAQVAVNREKRRAKRDTDFVQWSVGFGFFCIVSSCHNNAIFVGFSLICLESLGFL